jgi:ABC-2 type transport system permease protein
VLTVAGAAKLAQESFNAQIAQMGADTDQAEQARQQIQDQTRKGMVGAMFGEDPAMLDALAEVPLVILLVFKITFFFLPFYIALMGFDQVSGEVGPRSIRYLAVRARRSSVMFGKFLAQAVVLLALVLLVDLAVFVYAKTQNPDFTFGEMVPALVKFWVAAILFALAFLALTNFFSTAFRSPWASLLMNLSAVLGLLFFHAVSSFASAVSTGAAADPDAPIGFWGVMKHLSPFHYINGLLHPQFTHFGTSGAFYGAMALLLLGASYLILRSRDL